MYNFVPYQCKNTPSESIEMQIRQNTEDLVMLTQNPIIDIKHVELQCQLS